MVFGLIVAIIIIVLVALWMKGDEQNVSALSPQIAQFHASTTVEVGPDEVKTLFSSRNFCASRVITTSDAEIRFNFSGEDLTTTTGHIQTGSTTVAYPSGEYGCGAVKASAVASTTVDTSEYIW